LASTLRIRCFIWDALQAGSRMQSNSIKPERPIVSLKPIKEHCRFDL
jgi:hypothetical protein